MTTIFDARSTYDCEKLDEISPIMDEHALNKSPSAASSNFDCSICLEVSQDPVVTMCGHLFCWSCLHRWITIHSEQEECPVCKACVKDNIIPLYGRGKTDLARNLESKEATESDIPCRPSAHSHYAASPRSVRCNTGFRNHGFIGHQSDGFVAQENSATPSVAAFGLFPALFGIHNRTTANPVSSRMPTVNNSPSVNNIRRFDPQQESGLYWCLILLTGLASLCFLFF